MHLYHMDLLDTVHARLKKKIAAMSAHELARYHIEMRRKKERIQIYIVLLGFILSSALMYFICCVLLR